LEDLLSRKETAKLLSIGLPTLWDWSKLGIIKFYKLGSRIYYKRSEIFEKLEATVNR
jgi:excisionase family DNA binding protein